ncbi:response regulator [Salidesulfovibrio onnuriiensis]|uniref:response regulator n=1 Tax=Salidesulfovibrio onnuriiensis TaxID=2583823 RepID=UPI0011CBA822|nr:response regulator [Salidesulfovibrio onnuriiensis]
MKRILFIDDDQNILDSFRAMIHLKRREWKGSYERNAEAGLKLLSEERFDVVVADIRMPGMDGAEFFEKVRDIQPRTIRVILSGYSDMQCLFKSAKFAHQFLSKPCSSAMLIDTLQRLVDLDDIMSNDAIREIIVRLKSLPVIPEIYLSVTKELQKPEPDLKWVGKLVEKDVGLSATLLKVVNSAFFGFYERVISPAHAVVLLGLDSLKGLILGVKLLGSFELPNVRDYSVDKLWQHSLQTGYFAKVIATEEGMDKEFIESCFVGGILHDVGKLVLLTQLYDVYGSVLETVRTEGGPIYDLEQHELKVSHAEIGSYLLGTWGFKDSIVRGVHCHHTPRKCGKGLTTALVVHVANAIQHELAVWTSGYVSASMDMELLEESGLDGRLEAWRELCREYLEAQ